MEAHTGYYSLVQYCPDRSRLEAANVGVVLLCPALGFLECRMARGIKRVSRFFGDQGGAAAQIRAGKRMLANRLKADRDLVDPANFEKFRRVLSNELQISEPRPIRVENPRVELAQLFSELVETGGHHEPAPRPAAFERLDELFLTEPFVPLIQRDVKIHVPVLDREIEIPFAYVNGRLNLIQLQSFHQKTEGAMIREACNTAVQGSLLARHRLPGIGACQLVVVGSFAGAAAESRDRIGRMLAEYEVEFFADDGVDRLASRILQTAHR